MTKSLVHLPAKVPVIERTLYVVDFDVPDAPIECPWPLTHDPVYRHWVGAGVGCEVLSVLVLVVDHGAPEQGPRDPEAANPSLLVLQADPSAFQEHSGAAQ